VVIVSSYSLDKFLKTMVVQLKNSLSFPFMYGGLITTTTTTTTITTIY
jgi:hypothetical protein